MKIKLFVLLLSGYISSAQTLPDYGQVYVYVSNYGTTTGLSNNYLALMGAESVNTDTPPAVTEYTTNTSSPFYKFKTGDIGSSSITLAGSGNTATLLASGSGSDLDGVLEELGYIPADNCGCGQIIIVFPAGSDMTIPTSIQSSFNNVLGGAVPTSNADGLGWYVQTGDLHSITLDTPHLGYSEWYVFGRKSRSCFTTDFRFRLIAANGSIPQNETFTNSSGDNQWNTPSNWSSGIVPTTSTDVIISGFQTVEVQSSISAVAKHLYVENGDLTIAANSDLTLSGNFTNQSGTVTLNSDADEFASIIVQGSSYGDIVYQQKNLKSVLATDGDIVVMVDDGWLELWSARNENPLNDAETLKYGNQGQIVEL